MGTHGSKRAGDIDRQHPDCVIPRTQPPMPWIVDGGVVHEHVHGQAGTEGTGAGRGDAAAMAAEHGGFEDGWVGGVSLQMAGPEVEEGK